MEIWRCAHDCFGRVKAAKENKIVTKKAGSQGNNRRFHGCRLLAASFFKPIATRLCDAASALPLTSAVACRHRHRVAADKAFGVERRLGEFDAGRVSAKRGKAEVGRAALRPLFVTLVRHPSTVTPA
jgi:hypothetical protein